MSLVGAGPGDPSLITIGGAARLAEADVVVYDRLANPALLAHARADAERIYAGKQPDRHALTQDEINALLVELGRAGKRVVRLKGGDPFVFGRGGEEAEALAAAGVPFEIIPGVTSAIAAPAYAGIPVTHRALASSFAVVTAHEDPAKDESSIDWAHLAARRRHAGVPDGRRAAAADRGAADRAWARGGHAGCGDRMGDAAAAARRCRGRWRRSRRTLRRAGIGAPAVTVVGEVARLRDELRWFDARPLFGQARAGDAHARAGERAVARAGGAGRGADRAADDRDGAVVRRAGGGGGDRRSADVGLRLGDLQQRERGAMSSCGICARRASMRARSGGRRSRRSDRARCRRWRAHGLRADVVPERYVAEGLLEAFSSRVMRGQRVLLPRAEGARPQIVDGLEAMGARVDELTLYRSAVPADRGCGGAAAAARGRDRHRDVRELVGGAEPGRDAGRRCGAAAGDDDRGDRADHGAGGA